MEKIEIEPYCKTPCDELIEVFEKNKAVDAMKLGWNLCDKCEENSNT